MLTLKKASSLVRKAKTGQFITETTIDKYTLVFHPKTQDNRTETISILESGKLLFVFRKREGEKKYSVWKEYWQENFDERIYGETIHLTRDEASLARHEWFNKSIRFHCGISRNWYWTQTQYASIQCDSDLLEVYQLEIQER